MATRYGGTYLGSVFSDQDPLDQRRLHVLVPEIFGDEPVWAAASITDDSAQPGVGESVWVSFEHGDTDYPVWQRPAGDEATPGLRRYIGKYRARVINNEDPLEQRRVEVIVPEVDHSPAWATAGSEVTELDVPDIDTEVWIEYEYGDLAYPQWVGLMM